MECSLTNNINMAQKYLKEALEIAPNDPFVLHELGVIAFQSHRYVKYLYSPGDPFTCLHLLFLKIFLLRHNLVIIKQHF